jgi:hypothetical protein
MQWTKKNKHLSAIHYTHSWRLGTQIKIKTKTKIKIKKQNIKHKKKKPQNQKQNKKRVNSGTSLNNTGDKPDDGVG